MNLSTGEVRLFADSSFMDLATGTAAGGGLRNADNLAIDAVGNIYIVEDRNGGSDDDIWLAVDLNHDGDLLSTKVKASPAGPPTVPPAPRTPDCTSTGSTPTSPM